MSKVKLSFKSQESFQNYTWYDETPDGLQILFYTDNEKDPPLVIPKALFENWLGEQGAFVFEYLQFDPHSGDVFTHHKHAMASDYWMFCDRSQVLTDLREYCKTL